MFTQFMLDKKSNQTRGIFDTYIYRSDTDTLAEIQAAGYFLGSRFAPEGSNPDKGWPEGKLEVRASDGYAEGFIDAATGTFTASISG